jgi:hypothetical protein
MVSPRRFDSAAGGNNAAKEKLPAFAAVLPNYNAADPLYVKECQLPIVHHSE